MNNNPTDFCSQNNKLLSEGRFKNVHGKGRNLFFYERNSICKKKFIKTKFSKLWLTIYCNDLGKKLGLSTKDRGAYQMRGYANSCWDYAGVFREKWKNINLT